jgi:hypothetical protein
LVTYHANPAQLAHDRANSKSEIRISKQSENPNAEKIQISGVQIAFFRVFRFYVVVSDCLMSGCGLGTSFEIRISRRREKGRSKTAPLRRT